ncbi:nucleoside phosphorylase domain-containing protein [Hysterangium stoloniferum]|nr:nucleoside phosphorylase domain-containing protein [Hysterangium stoloniferum]
MTSSSFSSTLDALREQLPEKLLQPVVGIVCGSGLSTLASSLRDKVLISYESLPGFSKSTVPGHKSELAFGFLGSPERSVPVVAMLGRFHPYEGHSMTSVVYPIRVMAKLGVKNLLITNASGSLNPNMRVGTSMFVVIHDHVALPNLSGFNPLLGPQTDLSLPRFLALSNAYSRGLRKLVFHAAHQLGIPKEALAEGTYAWVSGPTYETPAEGRLLRAAGADVVGMSTIPEVLAAREMGLEVTVLSLITNAVVIPESYRSIREEVEAELAGKPFAKVQDAIVSHEEVLQIGREKAELMRRLVEKVVELVPLT